MPRGAPGEPDPQVEAILAGRDRQVDVALTAARIAREDDRAIDVQAVVDEVEAWACRLRLALTAAPRSPEARLATLVDFFFEGLGFTAAPTRATRLDEDRLGDLLLPYVVRRRRGHCVGLSSVFLALANRADLPVFGVSAPGHFFARWDGEGLRANVELTARGARRSDDSYVERFGIERSSVDRGVYLQSLRRREVLVEALNNRANLYWDRGDEARATRDLDRVVRASHNYARAYVGRGFAALRRGALAQAREDLERALALDPADGRAHLLLGQVSLREGAPEAARAAFARACEVAAPPAQARTFLGRALHLEGRLDEARRAHQEALRADPACHMAWVHLALVHQAVGEREEARRALHAAARLAPRSLVPREGLALLDPGAEGRVSWRSRARRWQVARAYEARLAAAPDAAAVRAAYVRFAVAAGSPSPRALHQAQLLARSVPTARHLELLAQLLHQRGQARDALAALEEALALAADPGPLAERLERLRAEWRGPA